MARKMWVYDPRSGGVNGAHLEPTIDEKTLRQRLGNAINATLAP